MFLNNIYHLMNEYKKHPLKIFIWVVFKYFLMCVLLWVFIYALNCDYLNIFLIGVLLGGI